MNINGRFMSEPETQAYVNTLAAKIAELEACVAELEEKHFSECAQIAHYDDELRRAKELLKAAVEDIQQLNILTVDGEGGCLIEKQVEMETCLECPLNTGNAHICGWRHRVEALTLIGEDINVPASVTDANIGGKKDGERNG